MTVSELYPNVKPREDGLIYLEAINTPQFRVSGLLWKDSNKNYNRIDSPILEECPTGVQRRAMHTTGVQVTLKTNTQKIGAHIVLFNAEYMNHMADNGVGGFDIYRGNGSEKRYWHVGWNDRGGDFSQVEGCDGEMIDYTFHLPLYSGVKSFEIGLCPDAEIAPPTPYAVEKPVIFYGSSITQGGCASHPGNCYINMLSRMLNINTVNLGFSGACLGEPILAKIIAEQDAAAFVIDYDHNASGAEFLAQTHELFYKTYRELRPNTPVIFMTKPDYDDNPSDGEARKQVIYQNYKNAVAAGDKHLYFLDGSKFFGNHMRDCCTVDRNHPTDLGFSRIADAVLPVLKQCLSL